MTLWKFEADSPEDLDQSLRSEVLALDNLGRGDEIHGTIIVSFSNQRVKAASLVPALEARGVAFRWEPKA